MKSAYEAWDEFDDPGALAARTAAPPTDPMLPFATQDPALAAVLCREWNGTRVVNIRVAPFDFYLGRGGVAGNPFHIKPGRTRDQALWAYRAYFLSRPHLMKLLPTLEGQVLGCFCDPMDCHGHVIVGLLRDGWGL